MRTVYAQKNKKIILGRQGEDKAVRVVWPGIVSDWSSLYGDGSFQLSVRRFGDENAYPVVVEVNGDDIRFTVTSAETAIAGNGKCELTYIANGTIAKSATWETVVLNSLTGQTPSEPPEEPAKSWFTSIQGQIGNLADLETASKDNLVAAINEAAQSGGGSGGSGVQPDWNQNNPSAPDYVKNRPFYAENPVETVLLEEQAVTFTNGESDTSFNFKASPEDINHIKVTWDGTEYICIPQININSIEFGNEFLNNAESEDTGEPFFYDGDIFIAAPSADSHQIKVSKLSNKIIKIEPNYMPNSNIRNGSGFLSIEEGSYTTASGDFSHAEGSGTTASGESSHAEGYYTTASGTDSHAEGSGTTASGIDSHAEGSSTTASCDFSHAEGTSTKAIGVGSHAEGGDTTASGKYAHAEGYWTTARSENQHVQGKYNVEDSQGKYAHIVGNGTSNSKRSNAHTLTWSGDAWYAGDVYVGSTSGTNRDEGSKKLATEEYVDSKQDTLIQSGATVGQIAKITAVDSVGKPTAWEAVDMPSGGGSGGKQLLYRHNISQDTVLTADSFDTSGANIDLSVYSHLYIRGMFICNSPTETYACFYLNGTKIEQIQYFNRIIGQAIGFEADMVCLKTQNKSSAGLLSFAWCSEYNLQKFDRISVTSKNSTERVNDNLQSIGFSAVESADIFAVKAGSYVEVWGD